LEAPATLTFPLSVFAPPAGVAPQQLFVAYRDPVTGKWIPEGGVYDATTQSISLSVDHFTDWQLFALTDLLDTLAPGQFLGTFANFVEQSAHPEQWNWAYWMPVLKQAATLSIPGYLSAIQTLTTPCRQQLDGYTVDAAASAGMIEGCLGDVGLAAATVRVFNLRAFHLAVQDPTGGISDLAPGEGIDLSVAASRSHPAAIVATLTRRGLALTVIEILLRIITGDTFAGSSSAFVSALGDIYTAQQKFWDGLGLYEAVTAKPPDYTAASEHLVGFVTSKSTFEVFLSAAIAAGNAYHIAPLANIQPAAAQELIQAVNWTDMIVSTGSWLADYFVNVTTELRVSGPKLAWTPIAPLPAAVFGSSAVELADGRVLVPASEAQSCGCGFEEIGAPSPGVSDAVFDPSSSRWETTAPTVAVGSAVAVVPLADGRALSVGSFDTAQGDAMVSRPAAEVLDPRTLRWTAIAPPAMVWGYAVAVLKDGRVVIFGGGDNTVDRSRLIQSFDPRTGHWTNAGQLLHADAYAGAIVLPDGRVLVVNGSSTMADPAVVDVELFDPASGAVTRAASINTGSSPSNLWLLPDGRVGMLWMRYSTADESSHLELAIYDPSANAWTSLGAPSLATDGVSLLPLTDGSVLFIGGSTFTSPRSGGCSVQALREVRDFNLVTGVTTTLPPLLSSCSRAVAVQLSDGRVLVAGGCPSVPLPGGPDSGQTNAEILASAP